MNRKLWHVALVIWFILWGILAVTNIRFDAQTTVMGVLAVGTGLLIAFDK